MASDDAAAAAAPPPPPGGGQELSKKALAKMAKKASKKQKIAGAKMADKPVDKRIDKTACSQIVFPRSKAPLLAYTAAALTGCLNAIDFALGKAGESPSIIVKEKVVGGEGEGEGEDAAEKKPAAAVIKGSISGDNSIARYIARFYGGGKLIGATSTPTAAGADPLLASQVDQWMDATLYLSAQDLLHALQSHLQGRTYLVGYSLTLADVAVYQALVAGKIPPPTATQATGKDKAQQALVRWWSSVSAQPAIRDAPRALQGVVSTCSAKALKLAPKTVTNPTTIANGLPVLEGAEEGKVVVRFPPEPSGYLHIGHAKACLLNEFYARHYKGKLICRFDDTNPSKETDEFQESILADLKTMGVEPDMTTHTSDHFDLLRKMAEQCIKGGHAYMDDTPQEQMREERMARKESKHRNQDPKETLRLFKLLCEGNEEASAYCLRMKIDMQDPNGAMRDPVIYRANSTPHLRTGTKYKAYPTYDFACPIVDSHEGVTHALRTTEYNDRDAQYDFMLNVMKLRKVRIHSFARLNFVRTVLSKRKLRWFVETGKVEGWFDPRFPTIQGIVRRGVSMPALRDFIIEQGASKRIVNMQWDKFWSQNKKQYEPTAARYMSVSASCAVELHITTPIAGLDEEGKGNAAITVQVHPKRPEMGTRPMRLAKVLLLEGQDAQGLTEGEEVTLMRWGNVVMTKVERAEEGGKVVRLEGQYVVDGDVKKTAKKLSWIAKVDELVPARLVEFDYLITKDKIEEGECFEDFVTERTLAEDQALVDPCCRTLNTGDVVQLERRAFFRVDRPYIGEGKPLMLFMIPDGKTKAMSTLTGQLDHI